MIASILSLTLGAFAIALLLISGYLLLLTGAALWGRRRPPPPGSGTRRFAVLIPAHNEEALIGRLLESLHRLDYPRSRFDVLVVADNCDDATAVVARAHGAQVYERFDRSARAKGFALRWLLERIREEGRVYDAFVVLDADSVVAENLLRCLDARLQAGRQVVQVYYSVLNAGDSPVAALRHAALAAIHYLRPLGRSVLGLSCGLKGNGMCFTAPVLERFAWQWYTLAEDVEFHLALVREGIRVDFAPETRVLAEMPVTLQQARSQNARWERGRLQLLRHRVPPLVREGVRRRSWLRLDAAIEQAIPPLSVPFVVGASCLVGAVLLHTAVPAALAAFALTGQVLYLVAGLALARAPLSTYLALGYAPAYVAWKLWVYAQALVSTRSAAWVRTARVAHAGRALSQHAQSIDIAGEARSAGIP